jgi:hypothetical protein
MPYGCTEQFQGGDQLPGREGPQQETAKLGERCSKAPIHDLGPESSAEREGGPDGEESVDDG